MKMKRLLIVAFQVIMVLATTAVISQRTSDWRLLGYWCLCAGVIIFCMVSVIVPRKFTHLPPAPGRVLAIIPAYNESQEAINGTVWSLLNQTREVAEIHIMDDGSTTPLIPFEHPRVFWHRQANVGKRGAHVAVLKMFDRTDFDYVLTVDSDSTPYPDAVEHLLRAFSDPHVQAATGMIYIRNFRDNLITRAADMDIGMSCVMMRASRTRLGALETTSGALAMYRSDLIYDYLAGYAIECGTGDDRWLALRALLRGDVVAVYEAGVETDMPSTIKGTFRQRLRWSRSWWWMLPFVFANLSFRKILSPAFGLTQLLITPLFVFWLYADYALHGPGARPVTDSIWLYIGCYVAVRGGVAALYLIGRPNTSLRDKLIALVVGTPLSVILNTFMLTPTKYYALLKLRDNRWRSRSDMRMSLAEKIKATVGTTAVAGVVVAVLGLMLAAGTWPLHLPPPHPNVPVLNNNASAGKVAFTYDDGPGTHTLELVSELKAEHIRYAVFFMIGEKVAANPRIVAAVVKAGYAVEVHTWDHHSLTGTSTHTAPLTPSEVRLEFTKTINALVAAGAPRPTMWRPPYGDVDGQDVLIANSLGLRLVMPWSVDNSVTDSGDWVSGTTAATIVKNVTQGWSGGVVIHDGSIIAGHDGIEADAPLTIAALPQIVQWMNAHHLGAMTSVPANATGGIHWLKWGKQQAGNTGGG